MTFRAQPQNAVQVGITQSGMSQPGTMQAGVVSQLAYHEMMELHELLNFKTVCVLQAKMMSGLVFDQDLKALLEKDVQQSMTAINQLKSIYSAGSQFQ